MYIRKFTYKKEDLDCKLCTEYRGKKHSCPHDVCPFIAERIEAGAVTYWDAVSALIPAQYRCSRRLPKLADEYPGTFFLDERHRSRMEFLNTQLGYVPGRNTPAYYATMYLLTSNEVIHWRMDGGKCILQLRGVRPFLSNKYDITKHPNYKYTSDFDKKNALDIERFLSHRLRLKPDTVCEVFEADPSGSLPDKQ